MKIMILGCGGRLGRALCQEFGPEAVRVPRQRLDICDADGFESLIRGEHRPDIVVNAAAMTGIERCEGDYINAIRANAIAPVLLADICHGYNVGFIHFSTDYVCDGDFEVDITEESPYSQGGGAYAESKRIGEIGVIGLKGTVFRVSSIYGGDLTSVLHCVQQYRDGRGTLENPITVLDQAATPTSTYAIAAGVAQAISQRVPPGLYNMATPEAVEKRIVAATVMMAVAPGEQVHIKASGLPNRPQRSVLNSDKLGSLGISLPHWSEDLLATLLRDGLVKAGPI